MAYKLLTKERETAGKVGQFVAYETLKRDGEVAKAAVGCGGFDSLEWRC